MLSKTLIVCLLALICLQLAVADQRLDTRIASPFVSAQGQFPYIAAIAYNFFDVASNQTLAYRATGIIYSATSVITTANVFNKFPAGAPGGPPVPTPISISVGAFDSSLPVSNFLFNATIGKYQILPAGQPAGPIPADLIIIPQQFVQGSSTWDLAIIRLPAGASFNFSNPEIGIANFPTSSPIRTENLWAVAYGNQNPGGDTFPVLKFARMWLKDNDKCAANLTGAGVTRPFNFSQNFCVQSKAVAAGSGASFQGVCAKDIGGALVRSVDITNKTAYYEVIGLISWTSDNFTCNPVKPVPAIMIYLSIYVDNFFTPILGSLATVGNKQNPALNPNSAKKNFICGNGVVESPAETCDPAGNQAASPCCDTSSCNFKLGGTFCGPRPKTGKPNKCQTRMICDVSHTCQVRIKPNTKKPCGGKGSKTTCVNGQCIKRA